MAKLCKSGRFAILREAPNESIDRFPVGTLGILEIWESERRYPGKQGAVFYYPMVLENARGMVTQRYLKTSLTYEVTEYGREVVFMRADRRYVFEITGETPIRDFVL